MTGTKIKSMTGVEREWLLSELEYKGSCFKKIFLKTKQANRTPPPPHTGGMRGVKFTKSMPFFSKTNLIFICIVNNSMSTQQNDIFIGKNAFVHTICSFL